MVLESFSCNGIFVLRVWGAVRDHLVYTTVQSRWIAWASKVEDRRISAMIAKPSMLIAGVILRGFLYLRKSRLRRDFRGGS